MTAPDAPGSANRDSDTIVAILRRALSLRPGGTLLPAGEIAALLDAWGIDHARARGVRSLEHALTTAEEIGWPVSVSASPTASGPRRRAPQLDTPEALTAWWTQTARDHGPRALVEVVVTRRVPVGPDAIEVRVEIDQGEGGIRTRVSPQARPLTGLVDELRGLLETHGEIDRILADPVIVDDTRAWITEIEVHVRPRLDPTSRRTDT